MRTSIFACFGLTIALFAACGLAADTTIKVAAGESIQKAIDIAPTGAVISLAPGVYDERIIIKKPLTLEGAGYDKTTIRPSKKAKFTQAQKDAFFDQLEKTTDPRRRMMLAEQIANASAAPTILVDSTKDVVIQHLAIGGMPTPYSEMLGTNAMVSFEGSAAKMLDCTVVGPGETGIRIINGSDVEISHSLIAAMWNEGISVYNEDRGAAASKVHLADCDIRNCYSRCVTIGCEGSVIERCRISGSAWHGIRYDYCSPRIVDNLIFANARCGIYASGKTAATVSGNVFWKNEMDGMSCWFQNADTIRNNTFVDNLREGLAILGDSSPTVAKNVIANNPIGIILGPISGDRAHASGPPKPLMQANDFWKNAVAVQVPPKSTEPAPAGSASFDPKFAGATNFAIPKDSSAGATTPIALQSPWPIQPGEREIIPNTDTRDYQAWKKIAANHAPAGNAG